MNRILSLLFAVAATTHLQHPTAEGQDRPNIVVIMLDDLGYSDLGCYGGEIRTPNIDRLAADGLRLTRFYNCGRCCPTRAALMTGLYPHQVGLARNGRSLSQNSVTIAEALKGAGYQTAMAGKWHLSETPVLPQDHLKWVNHQFDPGRPFGPIETYPVNRGFERFYGIIWGVINYFDPFSLVEGDQAVPSVPGDYYITDAITDHANTYLREMARGDAPFFLYVAHCAPHWPLHARPEDIARYKDVYNDGWHALRESRYRRQLELGLFDPATHPLPELHGHGPDWDQLDGATRAREASLMEVHAAMVDRVDQGIGELLKALQETGEYENTFIILLADNGASPERVSQPGYDRPSETRDGRLIQYSGFSNPGSETTYGAIGSWWANAANTPFRFWKKESYEGGVHTPCIMHWPTGLKTPKGAIHDDLGHVIDILPTCLELASAEYPADRNGQSVGTLAGQSLVKIIEGDALSETRTLFFEHEGGRGVVSGTWKMSALPNSTWELFDITRDRTETTNAALQHPDVVSSLHDQWLKWAREVGVPEDVIRKAGDRK